MTGPDERSGKGREATSPWRIPAGGWKEVALRSWKEAGQDNISLVASGVAFCAVLAMVPMLGAVVLSYGLIATPQTVLENVRSLTSVMPTEVARLIGEQLANIVTASDGKKGLGLLIALAIALYGAMKGATAIITALNIAYDEDETRGFLKLNLLALAITAGAVLAALVAAVAIAAMSSLEALFPHVPDVVLALGTILSYVVLAAGGAAAAATLYRFAPNRQNASWTWLTPGSLLASLSWLLMTIGFGIYVANFGSYDATYGSLGAAVVLLTWLNLSAYVLLLGAEFNCELERQTAHDTTTGAQRPLGERGAYAADTVASGSAVPAKPPLGAPARSTSPAPRPTPAAGGWLTAVALRVVGVRRAGLLPSALASAGLAAMGRRDRPVLGVVLLATAGGLTWLRRPRARTG